MAVGAQQRLRTGPGWLRSRYDAARGRLRRLAESVRPGSPADVRTDHLRRLGEVWNVLGDAQTIVANGWLQNRWETVPKGRAPEQPSGSGTPAIPVDGSRACVVAAVVRATRLRDPSAGLYDAGPALDFLWDALQQSRGLGAGIAGGRSAPQDLRRARIRDLTRWNDQPGRTPDEVLALLDLAQSHVVFKAAAPPPRR